MAEPTNEQRKAIEANLARLRACADDECPKCDKCGVPVTTGMLAMMCPHGRACAFVDDDEHWQTVEEFRQDLGIERHPGAAPEPKGGGHA